MPLLRAFTCLAVLAGLFPAAANAAVKLVSREEPVVAANSVVDAGRAYAPRAAPMRFNMVGLLW